MCTMSIVMTDWTKRVQETFPQTFPFSPSVVPPAQVSRSEFEALKAEMESLKPLLQAAKKYDDATGQPDCGEAEKLILLRKIAEKVGVEFDI